MTAKATSEEQVRISHHLIDLLDIKDTSYNVIEYRRDAIKSLSQIHERNSAAIVVGGTNYYAESLIFNHQPLKPPTAPEKSIPSEPKNDEETFPANANQKLVNSTTHKFHPNDLRRNEERKLKIEKDASEKLNLDYSRTLFKDTLIIVIINRDLPFVHELVSRRVEEMLFEAPGFEEIFAILDAFFLTNVLEDDGYAAEMRDEINRGVMQAIGYKEFLPLYNNVNQFARAQVGNEGESFLEFRKEIIHGFKSRKFGQFSNILTTCVEELKRHTVKLYKSQIKWLRHRILSSPCLKHSIRLHEFDREIYERDGLKELFAKIRKEADDFVNDRFELPDAHLQIDDVGVQHSKQSHRCEICVEQFYNEVNFKQHMSSKAHKSKLKKVKIIDEPKHTDDKQLEYFCEPCKRTIVGSQYFSNHAKSKQHRKRVKIGISTL